MKSVRCLSLLFVLPLPSVLSFSQNPVSLQPRIRPHSEDATALFAENEKKKSGLDGNMRSKLLTESIAPWRTIRLFLYGALGSGAFLGGLINGSGAIANSNSPDFNLNTELMNVGIDFGAVVLFALLFKFDIDKQGELSGKVEEKIEKKKESKKIAAEMKKRESELAALPLEIKVSTDGETTTSTVGVLQRGALQHMIIVAGPKKACRDALVGANLLKMEFALNNVLVVPFETDRDGSSVGETPAGFGERPLYERQPYVARAPPEEWEDFIRKEFEAAVQQNGESVRTDGIALVVAKTGKIIRRGVGKVPWREMVEALEAEVTSNQEQTAA